MIRMRIFPPALLLEPRQCAEDEPLQCPVLQDLLHGVDDMLAPLDLDGVAVLASGRVRNLSEPRIVLEEGFPELSYGEDHMGATEGGNEGAGLI